MYIISSTTSIVLVWNVTANDVNLVRKNTEYLKQYNNVSKGVLKCTDQVAA